MTFDADDYLRLAYQWFSGNLDMLGGLSPELDDDEPEPDEPTIVQGD